MSLRTSTARKAISAETYGEYNKKENFVARVIPKTEDQTKRHKCYLYFNRIRTKLQSSFIFSALNSKEIEIVIGAMEEKKFAIGEFVIKQGDEGNNLYVVDSGSLTCVRIMVNLARLISRLKEKSLSSLKNTSQVKHLVNWPFYTTHQEQQLSQLKQRLYYGV